MINKSGPQTLRKRKVEQDIKDIHNKQITNDNHIIGVMKVRRRINDGVVGYFISSHKGVLLITGNYKIDNNIRDGRIQEKNLEEFLKLPQKVKKLQFYIIDYNNTSKVALEQVEGYDNIFEINGTLSFNNSFQWRSEGQIFKICSYQMTVSQAVDLMQRTANGEDGNPFQNQQQYSPLFNNCNDQQQNFITQITTYEKKMKNRVYFDGESALINHINNKNISRIQQRRIFSLPNIWLAAVVFKNLFGNYFLNIYIALKDFEPFALNYGQIEFLQMKDKTMRVQNCLEQSELRVVEQNRLIEDLEIIKNMVRSYEVKEHPYSNFLQHLKEIEY